MKLWQSGAVAQRPKNKGADASCRHHAIVRGNQRTDHSIHHAVRGGHARQVVQTLDAEVP
eukprot:scaffold965_cov262-Pinguiococcus_pyrenoidosus.AAC.3